MKIIIKFVQVAGIFNKEVLKMNFTGIGKIGAFVKQKNLIYAANY